VQDVPDDGDAPTCQLVEAPDGVAQGVEVEEGLGRVLAAAVARVDHGRRGVARGQGRCAGGRVPQHDRVGPEAVEGHYRVYQGLALGDGGAFVRERDHISPERLAASSNETAVRVEASKKARQTVFPTSAAGYTSLGVGTREIQDGPEVLAGPRPRWSGSS
jgi:hypothetical protein